MQLIKKLNLGRLERLPVLEELPPQVSWLPEITQKAVNVLRTPLAKFTNLGVHSTRALKTGRIKNVLSLGMALGTLLIIPAGATEVTSLLGK